MSADHVAAGSVTYLDSSALVKLVVEEPESGALIRWLGESGASATSALARVEVVRAVAAHGSEARARAQALVARVFLLRMDDELLDRAAGLGGEGLRSLDAIHLASALALGRSLRGLVTYDERMAEAAVALGLGPTAPGSARSG